MKKKKVIEKKPTIFEVVFPVTYKKKKSFLLGKAKAFEKFCHKNGLRYDFKKDPVPYEFTTAQKSLTRAFLKQFDKDPQSTLGFLKFMQEMTYDVALGFGLRSIVERKEDLPKALKNFAAISNKEAKDLSSYPEEVIKKFGRTGNRQDLIVIPFFEHYPSFKGVELEKYQGKEIVIPDLKKMYDFGEEYGTCTSRDSTLNYAYKGEVFRLFLKNSEGVIDSTFVIEGNSALERVYGIHGLGKNKSKDWTSQEVCDFLVFIKSYLTSEQIEMIMKNRWAHDYQKFYGEYKQEAFRLKRKFYYAVKNKKLAKITDVYPQFLEYVKNSEYSKLQEDFNEDTNFYLFLKEESSNPYAKLAKEYLSLFRSNSPMMPTLLKILSRNKKTGVFGEIQALSNYEGTLESKLEKISKLPDKEFHQFFWHNFDFFKRKFLKSGNIDDLNKIPFFEINPNFKEIESVVWRGQTVVAPTEVSFFRECGKQLDICTGSNSHIEDVVEHGAIRLFLMKDGAYTGTIKLSHGTFYGLKAGRVDFSIFELEEFVELLTPFLGKDSVEYIKNRIPWGHYKTYIYAQKIREERQLQLASLTK